MKAGMIQNPIIDSVRPGSTPQRPSDVGKAGDFAKLLGDFSPAQTASAQTPLKLRFSNHAVERMQQRGIHFSPEQLNRIELAADKAASKGARETLVLADDSALIVSHKNNTIVTVMDKEALKNNVFTQIDSTVFA